MIQELIRKLIQKKIYIPILLGILANGIVIITAKKVSAVLMSSVIILLVLMFVTMMILREMKLLMEKNSLKASEKLNQMNTLTTQMITQGTSVNQKNIIPVKSKGKNKSSFVKKSTRSSRKTGMTSCGDISTDPYSKSSIETIRKEGEDE